MLILIISVQSIKLLLAIVMTHYKTVYTHCLNNIVITVYSNGFNEKPHNINSVSYCFHALRFIQNCGICIDALYPSDMDLIF